MDDEKELLRLELKIKQEELKIKEKEFERIANSRFFYSPFFIGIITVCLSFLGSYLISKEQLKQSRKNFNAGLIENIMDDEVIVTKRKIEFLIETETLQENKYKIEKALSKLCKKSSSYYVQRGLKLNEEGKHFLAIRQFDIAVELDSFNYEAFSKRGVCNKLIGESLKSNEFIYRAINDFIGASRIKNTGELNFSISSLLSTLGENEKALDYCELAIKKKPQSSKYYNLKGKILINQGSLREACNAFKTSNNFNPSSSVKELSEYCK